MENVLVKNSKNFAARSVVASVAPSAFNDPLALETAWTPLKRGGANFQSTKLHQITPTRWEFRPSSAMKLFSGLFVIIGLGVCISAVTEHWPTAGAEWDRNFLLLAGFGLLFTFVGAWMGYATSTPTVFDKDHGYFVKNRKRPEHMVNPSTLKNFAEIRRIHALQLLAEYCMGDKSSYFSYELNLVLDDGSRLNVIDHGKLEAVRHEANALAEFLGKPLWDSI